jgi:hypothetical protein
VLVIYAKNAVHWQHIPAQGRPREAPEERDTVDLKSSEIKGMLRLAAERERRSAALMIESLILEYVREHGISQAKLSAKDKGGESVSEEGPCSSVHALELTGWDIL